MKKMTYFVMALALVLGFTQCKKEQIEPQNQGGKVRITLDVENSGNDGSRANVNPPHVTFEEGDQILVGYNNVYVGTLIHNGTRFEGNIDATVTGTQKLYFYFLGNKADVSSLTEGSSTTCTVNISDQANYPHLPVISMAPSNEDFDGQGTYTAHLLNKCSLMKFDVTSSSTAAICITGMNNQVTVNFDPTTADTDEGFSYNKDTEVGFMKLSGKDSEGKTYAIVLPQAALTSTGEAYTIDGYEGTRPALPALGTDQFYTSYTIDVSTQSAWDGDLAKLTNSSTPEYATARNGMTVYGTLAANVKVSIADGATVTLDGVSINANGAWTSGNYAGITCKGNATIILKDGTENIVRGFYEDYPGISIPENRTLTIKGGAAGTGKLTASSNGYGAGIGGGYLKHCGNIEIQGGDINATGGSYAAGIGGGESANCGTITISGGTVTATGGEGAAGIGGSSGSSYDVNCGAITISGGTVTATGGDLAPGIGSGFFASCGDITITNGVTKVTATKGEEGEDPVNSIGVGYEGTCGTVMFGDETIYDGSFWIIAPESGSAYGGLSFSITTVTNTDDTWVLQPE